MAFNPESLRRWARQGPQSQPSSSPPGPARSPGRPQARELPPPPPGFGYVADEAHGWVIVPLGNAPARGPARRAPQAVPAGADGAAVIPIRRGSTQLVRGLIGGQDPYDDFLAKLPEIGPGDYGSHVAAGLVPNEEEIANLPEMVRPIALDPNTQAHEDPADDAFGGKSLKSAGIKPLGDKGGA